MRITNFVLKAVFSVAVLGLSTMSFAHNDEDHSVKSTTKAMPMNDFQMNQASMNHAEMDHSQHSAQDHQQHMQMMEGMNHAEHSAHMSHQAQPVNDPQKEDSTEKSKDKNTQKGDQHAQH